MLVFEIRERDGNGHGELARVGDPMATVAAARVDLQSPALGGTPLWLGFKEAGSANPAAVPAALA